MTQTITERRRVIAERLAFEGLCNLAAVEFVDAARRLTAAVDDNRFCEELVLAEPRTRERRQDR